MPTSTIISPAADSVVAFLAAQGFTAYKWARGDYDLPAAVVELPTVEREPGGSQLGGVDWQFSFPVVLYFPLDEAASDQQAAAGHVEAVINAVDDNPDLGDPTIMEDAVISSAAPDFDTDSQRPMVVYACTLDFTKYVPA
jgi:hypothetical protein